MTDHNESGMQFPPEEELPAVQPPSTSFFVQLFLLPAIIVFGLVAVWFLFGKITDSHQSPEEFLSRMQADRGDRWKAAHDLSRLLTPDSQYVRDYELAYAVNAAFEQALEEKNPKEDHQKYLEYLAGALGRFEHNVGVPALRRATRPEFSEDVRWTALLALANLADRLDDLDDPNLVLELRELIADPNMRIRELAAMALGITAEPQGEQALEGALEDLEPTVRYNAARALANYGSTRGLAVYKEMLDPDTLREQFIVDDGLGNKLVDENRVLVVVYEALRGIDEICAQNPDADVQALAPNVQKLTSHENAKIAAEAKQILLKFDLASAEP